MAAANKLASKKARRRIVAYVESYDDVFFWRTVLTKFEDDTRYFEVMLPTREKLERGKKSALMNVIGEMLMPYQLSSGEKQMLAILLTVLIEDNQHYVLFMDEPEVSLHVDWQKNLIDMILDLNPNVQIILTTHSPAVIMNGWLDKVTEVTDITL